jgi:hypothetical protein
MKELAAKSFTLKPAELVYTEYVYKAVALISRELSALRTAYVCLYCVLPTCLRNSS